MSYSKKHREREKKKVAKRVAKWRADKHREDIESWTEIDRLLNKKVPREVKTIMALRDLAGEWNFDHRKICCQYDKSGLLLSRMDGYGGTILYTGENQREIFANIKRENWT